MALNFKAHEFIVAKYNAAKGTNFDPSQIVFTDLKDLRNSPIKHPLGYNTAIKATVDGKTVIFYYNRATIVDIVKDAPAFGNGTPLKLLKDAVGSTRKLIPSIERFYGLSFDQEDFVDEPMAIENGLASVVLTTGAKSYTYLPGEKVTVAIDGVYKLIDGELARVYESGFYPGAYDEYRKASWPTDLSLPYGPALVYGKDYSAIKTLLRQFIGKYPSPAEAFMTKVDQVGLLAKSLSDVDKIPWSCSTPANSDWNLFGTAVVYNGPTKDFKGIKTDMANVPPEQIRARQFGRADMDNVLVLRTVSGTGVPANRSAQAGAFFFHYND